VDDLEKIQSKENEEKYKDLVGRAQEVLQA
jgi:hypothetical protein